MKGAADKKSIHSINQRTDREKERKGGREWGGTTCSIYVQKSVRIVKIDYSLPLPPFIFCKPQKRMSPRKEGEGRKRKGTMGKIMNNNSNSGFPT